MIPEYFVKRCGDASKDNQFEYETFHRLLNNNWVFFTNNNLDTKVYTGLCLNG